MKTPGFTEAQAQKESARKLLSAGWKDGEITDALEKASKRGNDMIEISVMIRDAQGNEESRGYPDSNIIEDYAPVEASRVVPLPARAS